MTKNERKASRGTEVRRRGWHPAPSGRGIATGQIVQKKAGAVKS